MIIKSGIDFDDVLLQPIPSRIISRNSVSLNTQLKGLNLSIPIIASPMKGIVGIDLIKEMGRLGGIGILHRFYNNEEQPQRGRDLISLRNNATNFGVSVGLNDDFYKESLEAGASIICIDVANGYIDSVLEFSEKIAGYINANNYNCLLMAGNVATLEGARNLYNNGVSLIRTGIGSGALCITRNVTGIGVPQITAIYDCSYEGEVEIRELGTKESMVRKWKNPWFTVADGGIRNSGDAVKALAAGADFLMIGTILGSCYEADHDGEITGMAAREFQEQFYGSVKKSVEGIKKKVEKNISLEDFLQEFVWNMKSAFTYLDSENIVELHQKARFISVGKGSIKNV